MTISPAQIRAARALLDWNQQLLADKVGVSKHTISKIERGDIQGGTKTLAKIHTILVIAGLDFIEDDGVKKKTTGISSYAGREEFQEFYTDIAIAAEQSDQKDFLVSNVNEEHFLRWLNEDTLHKHYDSMKKHKISYKILIAEGDTTTPGDNFNAEYKWMAADQFYSVPCYIYGDKVAFMSFEEDNINVFVIRHKNIVDLCRKQFHEMWNRAKDIPSDIELNPPLTTQGS